MKKLLLLGILVGLGSTVLAIHPPIQTGPLADAANYGNPVYRPWAGDITEDGGPTPIGGDYGRINIFRQNGGGDVDTATMDVKIEVHRPVRIFAEVPSIYAEGIHGDQIAFGDINWLVRGSKDVEVEFEFDGDVFNMLTRANVLQRGEGGSGVELYDLEDKVIDVTGLQCGENEEALLEMDLYFTLGEICGEFDGTITATAMYK